MFHRKEGEEQLNLEELIFNIATNATNDGDDDVKLMPLIEVSDQFNSIAVKGSGK